MFRWMLQENRVGLNIDANISNNGTTEYGGWGSNRWSELNGEKEPEGYQPVPRTFTLPSVDANDIAKLYAYAAGTVALLKNGDIWRWGLYTTHKQLAPEAEKHTAPEKVEGLPPACALAVRDTLLHALTADGDLWELNYFDNTPKRVLTDVAEVAAGSYHTLALKRDGTLWGWGDNGYGQIVPDRIGEDIEDPVQIVLPFHKKKKMKVNSFYWLVPHH
jgi:alpha-tubulin suppressor-like RCC1 family protein